MPIYSAFIVVPHTPGAQVRITQFYRLQITPCWPSPCKRSPDGTSPDWGCRHLIAAYSSFIYPKGRKAESAWLADPIVYLVYAINHTAFLTINSCTHSPSTFQAYVLNKHDMLFQLQISEIYDWRVCIVQIHSTDGSTCTDQLYSAYCTRIC